MALRCCDVGCVDGSASHPGDLLVLVLALATTEMIRVLLGCSGIIVLTIDRSTFQLRPIHWGVGSLRCS
jgi:hypothetical protein